MIRLRSLVPQNRKPGVFCVTLSLCLDNFLRFEEFVRGLDIENMEKFVILMKCGKGLS